MKLHDQMPELYGATYWINGEKTKRGLIGEKLTLIHFWSTSCHLCKEMMPEVNRLRDRLKKNLNVVAVHMPRHEKDFDMKIIQSNVERYAMTQPIFIDSELTLSDAFDNQHVPAYYLFDQEGRLRHFQAGGNGMKMLERRINRILYDMKNY